MQNVQATLQCLEIVMKVYTFLKLTMETAQKYVKHIQRKILELRQ